MGLHYLQKGRSGLNEKIAIITDSGCDLPLELAEKYDIRVLPLKVIYPEGEYSDRVDIQPDEVYRDMPARIPTTSMPSPQEIKNLFEKVRQEGFTQVLAVHLSSNLSGTYDTVKMIAKNFEGLVIKTIDTKTLSMASGWMVLEAARNIASGFSLEKAAENLQNIRPKVHGFYVIETLEYLRRGGRIGAVASMLGQFLHLKPIISVDPDGKYFTFCKAKGRRKSIEKLIQIVEDKVKDQQIRLAVLNGGSGSEFDALVKRLKDLPNIKDFVISEISPALGVHTGPGLLAICIQEI